MTNSPTFVARFADGTQTRMTTYVKRGGKLDVARGVKLSQHAYNSRTKHEPPTIVEGHFEKVDGTVLESYDAAALKRQMSSGEHDDANTKEEKAQASHPRRR